MNLPDVQVIRCGDRRLFAVVTSGAPDGFPGCYWLLYDEDGKHVGGGMSKGWDGRGAGSFGSAMALAVRAAKRRLLGRAAT